MENYSSSSSGIIIKWDSVQLTAADLCGAEGKEGAFQGGESWPVCWRLARRMAISSASDGENEARRA